MPEGTHHRRAGKLGGEATKQRHGEHGFYQRIGSRGGRRTMELHPEQYGDIRRRAGHRTRATYGASHYQDLAARSAQQRQSQNALRDQAIQRMLDDGWKIPTIISLTWEDLPRLAKYLEDGLGKYLRQERPDSDSHHLFLSRSGKPLGLANTYTVMRHFRKRQEK